MGIIYSKCYNGVIRVPGFADEKVTVVTSNFKLKRRSGSRTHWQQI